VSPQFDSPIVTPADRSTFRVVVRVDVDDTDIGQVAVLVVARSAEQKGRFS